MKLVDRVYFCDRHDVIKIGFASDGKRVANHSRDGLVLRAVLPARYDDEQSLHSYFHSKGYWKGGRYGREYYKPVDALYEYIDKLLKRGYASPMEEELDNLSTIPFSVWKPGSEALNFSLDSGFQYNLWDSRSPKERVQRFSEFAHCNSISDEWYTPKKWVDLSRMAMGSIDLDPATSAAVNRKWINAPLFYSKEINGLSRDMPWAGNVWLNPPYGRGDNASAAFLKRLCEEVTVGNVSQAITCLNLNSMSAKWFVQTVMASRTIHCIPHGRVEFIPPTEEMSKSSPNKGTVFSYFGENKESFVTIFKDHGEILRPW